jgi:Na+/H+ antiporter NhaC
MSVLNFYKYLLSILLFLIVNTVSADVLHNPVIASIENYIVVPSSMAHDSIFVLNGLQVKSEEIEGQKVIKFIPEHKKLLQLATRTEKTQIVLPNQPIPLWMSILPPLFAIVLALIFKEVITSLLLGVFVGASIIGYYSFGFVGILTGWLQIIEQYLLKAVVPDPVAGEISRGHISVIVFSILIGGLVAVISQNGGMMAVVKKMSKWAKNAQSGQFVTWLLGVAIFFDDYANTLVVGNTMRPVTDKLKISREKLSYIVDSTAAPVAAIAFITTWIGAELDYIQSGVQQIAEIDNNTSAYSIFLSSLRYSFYPIFTLIFMLILIWKKKDFGPMYKAEREARQRVAPIDGKIEVGDIDKIDAPREKMRNAIIPVMVIVLGTLAGLVVTGYDAAIWANTETGFFTKLSATIGASDSYKALLWSSFLGISIAVILTVSQRIANLTTTIEWAMEGFKNMLSAVSILILAWSLAIVTEQLHTSDFMAGFMSGNVGPIWVPVITFLLAGLVSFSTGSSWSTMAILYPIMLLSSWKIAMAAGYSHAEAMEVFYNVTACVLAGSVLGDHCSPISDTTILSSLASECNHMSHVRTQLPYALIVGAVSLVMGTLLSSLGVPYIVCVLLGIGTMYFIVSYFGKMVDN